MRHIFDPRQSGHAPERELHNGEWTAYAESPGRCHDIVARLTGCDKPRDFGLAPILAVHDPDYVEFLRTAHAEWLAAGRAGDAIGYTFPVRHRRPLALQRIDARLGAYSFDAATPIAAGTWDAAYWGAQSALTALDALASGDERHAFALCRPPGHHAGRDYMGGYCYLNNAAIAARQAQALGLGPVAILDVDYHHGNGTQDIFYEDASVFFASIHADPATDYPFFWGHVDETGAGGGAGTTLNLALRRGTDGMAYLPTLDHALDAIVKWGARFVVLSFGADTHTRDPISFFELGCDDYRAMGRRIATPGLPVLVVMEGGYAVGELGASVSALLSGLEN